MKAVLSIALGILTIGGFILLWIILDLGGMKYREATSEMRGQSDAEVRIESATSRIANYEMFYDLCSAVQKKEDAIDILRGNGTINAKKLEMAIASNLTQRANTIAKYNAESRKSYTAARFKASDLPWDLPREAYDGTNRTTCTN